MLYFIPVYDNTRIRLVLCGVGMSGTNGMCMVYSLCWRETEGEQRPVKEICQNLFVNVTIKLNTEHTVWKLQLRCLQIAQNQTIQKWLTIFTITWKNSKQQIQVGEITSSYEMHDSLTTLYKCQISIIFLSCLKCLHKESTLLLF